MTIHACAQYGRNRWIDPVVGASDASSRARIRPRLRMAEGEAEMFLQIIEQRTTRIDEMMALEERWREATEGKRTIRRSIVVRDREDPNRFLVLAFFDDLESMRAQSELPETAEFADRQAELLTGLPHYRSFDVIKQVEY